LRAISFYDEACGDVYLRADSEMSYRPSALVIVDELISLCDQIREEIEERFRQNAASKGALPHTPQGTRAAAFLAALKGSTSDVELDAVCALASSQVAGAVIPGDGGPSLTYTRAQYQKNAVFDNGTRASITESVSRDPLGEDLESGNIQMVNGSNAMVTGWTAESTGMTSDCGVHWIGVFVEWVVNGAILPHAPFWRRVIREQPPLRCCLYPRSGVDGLYRQCGSSHGQPWRDHRERYRKSRGLLLAQSSVHRFYVPPYGINRLAKTRYRHLSLLDHHECEFGVQYRLASGGSSVAFRSISSLIMRSRILKTVGIAATAIGVAGIRHARWSVEAV
jgi:hypothetical protein